jgi:hypothetical protein
MLIVVEKKDSANLKMQATTHRWVEKKFISNDEFREDSNL